MGGGIPIETMTGVKVKQQQQCILHFLAVYKLHAVSKEEGQISFCCGLGRRCKDADAHLGV